RANHTTFTPLSIPPPPAGRPKTKRRETSGRLARAGRNAAAATSVPPEEGPFRIGGRAPAERCHAVRRDRAAHVGRRGGGQRRTPESLGQAGRLRRCVQDALRCSAAGSAVPSGRRAAAQRADRPLQDVELRLRQRAARRRTLRVGRHHGASAPGHRATGGQLLQEADQANRWVDERMPGTEIRPGACCLRRSTRITAVVCLLSARGVTGAQQRQLPGRSPSRASAGSELAQWPLAPRASRSLGGLPRIRTRTGRRRAGWDRAPGSDHGKTGERAEGAESSGLQEPLTSKRAPRKCMFFVRPPLILDSETSTAPRLWYECHPQTGTLAGFPDSLRGEGLLLGTRPATGEARPGCVERGRSGAGPVLYGGQRPRGPAVIGVAALCTNRGRPWRGTLPSRALHPAA
ncbi:unnamed protein product, partial [Ixodes pacificus]